MSQLRKLAAQGLTSTQISQIMGVSRGAVIGKQQREGILLLSRASTFGVSPNSQQPSNPNAVLPIAERSGVGPAMLALKPGHCRWPVGAVEEPDFHYCSAHRMSTDRPYCAKHAAMGLTSNVTARAASHKQALTWA